MKALIITGSLLLLIYISYRTYRIATLDAGLGSKVTAGAVILDVRTPSEYSRGHIEGSVNMPLSTLKKGSATLDTGKTYITCCSHGFRSVKAETLLKGQGFKHVYNGGAWSDLEKYTPKREER
jgi:rhodanese-related sulfurtransferase